MWKETIAKLKTAININKKGISTVQIISLFVAILLFAILIPVAFKQVYTASTSGWDTSTVNIWYLVPLLVVVAVVIGVAMSLVKRGE